MAMCDHECLLLKNVLCFVMGYLVFMETYITLFDSAVFYVIHTCRIGPINVCTNFETNSYTNAKIICFV